MRGVEKVKSIALMHALTHNMVCGWRLIWGVKPRTRKCARGQTRDTLHTKKLSFECSAPPPISPSAPYACLL
ncbi:hypothetical protein CCR94_10470 [Rhodoblastus sphagnicola]|uniref:Uncharacterized protein n=1 Tax=Rhodoblastus sphagnicola TaxID=333368 RepID=A0A2S6N8W2_9HYPH|nr:hypothetical protein CCR94_10470 [Rhodoblastus sphagnicola]